MSIRAVSSLNAREIATASRGLLRHAKGSSSCSANKIYRRAKGRAYYAGQPSVKSVLDILAVGSSTSISVESFILAHQVSQL